MSKALSYKERQRYSNEQVEEEMNLLGIPTDYPAENEFSEDEITDAIAGLSDYYLWEDVATLKAGNYNSKVIVAFANLASALGSDMTADANGMRVRQATSDQQRRDTAVSNLKSKVYQENRDVAIRSLMSRDGL